MKKICALLLAAMLIVFAPIANAADILDFQDTEDVPASVFSDPDAPTLSADDISIPVRSAILIERSTGTVIYEKEADLQLEPASVTKIMTILLIAEAIDAGTLALTDEISVSAYAAGMGGSQIFLEEGEKMSMKDMLKAIVVSSANDAAVAVAEHLCGTEQAFVAKMNERAAQLGMTNTLFCNCTGLLDQPEHVTTARDVSLMSRELLSHEWIHEYTTIWMDTVRNGAFGLSNTNKLIYYYSGSTGLKTGFTQRAGYCLSASAERDGVEYIAVVMKGETSADRFESAKTLLNYAFANYTLISAIPDEVLLPMRVTLGSVEYAQPMLESEGRILIEKSAAGNITKTVTLSEELTAPVTAGQQVGLLTLKSGENIIAEVGIVIPEDIPRLSWWQIFVRLLAMAFCGNS